VGTIEKSVPLNVI